MKVREGTARGSEPWKAETARSTFISQNTDIVSIFHLVLDFRRNMVRNVELRNP